MELGAVVGVDMSSSSVVLDHCHSVQQYSRELAELSERQSALRAAASDLLAHYGLLSRCRIATTGMVIYSYGANDVII